MDARVLKVSHLLSLWERGVGHPLSLWERTGVRAAATGRP